MWVMKVRDLPWEVRQNRAKECAQIIAEKGDVLQFGGGKRGEAGKAFNALAEGLASAAFSPGGVKFGGLHFETTT